MTERIIILIDGQSTHAAMRADGTTIDYAQMVAALTGDRYLVRPYFFALEIEGPDEYRPLRSLLDFLEYHGFAVETKVVRELECGRREKTSIAVDLASRAFDLCDAVEHVVICTGDEQFVPLLKALQRRGLRVTIAAVLGRCSDELRRQADHFIDLDKMREAITRPARVQREAISA